MPFREDDLWNGYPEETNAPYGVAKKSILVGAQAYREQYGLNAIFLLPANLYGPRDNFDRTTSHVIPALIRKMVESPDEVVLVGRRHADPRVPLRGRRGRRASCSPPSATTAREPVNLGTGYEISIRELAELVAELTGFEGEIVWDTSQPNGQPRRRLDTSRARELFGFEARTPLREGLERTIAWYRAAAPQTSERARVDLERPVDHRVPAEALAGEGAPGGDRGARAAPGLRVAARPPRATPARRAAARAVPSRRR